MRIKLLMLCLFIQVIGSAQQYTTKYFDWAGNEVSKDQAYYAAIGKIPVDGDYFVGKVIEKFVSNKRIKAKKIYNEKGRQTGVGVEYFENGQVKEKYQLKHGHVFGGFVSWYPNGQKALERQYTDFSALTEVNYLTYNVWDSLGNQLVTDGNGSMVEYDDDFRVMAKGKVYKGRRSGTWKGYYPNGNLFYVEKHKNGELVYGNSILMDSTKHRYTKIKVLPSPTMGFVKYYEKLSKAIKYPKSAKKIGLQGVVHIAYTINKEGLVTDYHVVKSLSEECDEEALRIFREVKVKWNVGTSRGNPDEFIMILPVSFKL